MVSIKTSGIILMISALLVFFFTPDQKHIITDDLTDEYDTIIIPGQGITPDNKIPPDGYYGVDVKARVDFALSQFLSQQQKPRIILSGHGTSYEQNNSKLSEAQAMHNYLAPLLSAQGFDSESYLIIEDQSYSTFENVIYSKKHLQKTDRILVLVNTKSYNRQRLVFDTMLCGYDITVASITAQTPEEKNRQWLGTQLTKVILFFPDSLKAEIVKSYRLLALSLGKESSITP